MLSFPAQFHSTTPIRTVANGCHVCHVANEVVDCVAAHSMIFAQDFETPKEMAAHLKYLDSNETAYLEYHRWREGPVMPLYVSLHRWSFDVTHCRYVH